MTVESDWKLLDGRPGGLSFASLLRGESVERRNTLREIASRQCDAPTQGAGPVDIAANDPS
jgi:hypothetical protein